PGDRIVSLGDGPGSNPAARGWNGRPVSHAHPTCARSPASSTRTDCQTSAAVWVLKLDRGTAGAKGTSMTDTVRVLIVAKEQLTRRGLEACLESEPTIEIVGSAATAEEGYRLADHHLPEVVLIGT